MSADRGQALPVVYSPLALQELDVIWDWNEKNFSRNRAARYVDFLQRHIDALCENHHGGRLIESRPELRYIQIKHRKRGHGHIAVYRVSRNVVNVLHIFHTAQDWQAMLAEDESGRL
jgi:plasmid stabilization system protein ParE